MKFLILRFSSIGDIVLTTPVVRCLKTQIPSAEVHFATKIAYRSIVENNPYLDKSFYLENALADLIGQLKAERYDYVIDLHNNLRSRLIKLRLGVKSFSFDKLNLEKWLLVRFKYNIMPDIHIVDRYLKTVEAFGVKNDNRGLDYFIPENDEVPLDWLPETHQKNYIAFAIGGQHATKKLPLLRLIELCNINYPIILLGGKEDFETGEKIINAFETQAAARLFNGCGKFSLNQSASLVRQAKVVFTHDTGLMHIAAAFKKKVYSIWGNTVPAFGMYPYQTKFVALEVKDLPCRPCSKIGYDKCPLGHFKCMNEINFTGPVFATPKR